MEIKVERKEKENGEGRRAKKKSTRLSLMGADWPMLGRLLLAYMNRMHEPCVYAMLGSSVLSVSDLMKAD